MEQRSGLCSPGKEKLRERERRHANDAPRSNSRSRDGFTLLELLLALAVVAIISVVVVYAINPVELMRRARDSSRLSDLNIINKALDMYDLDVGGSMGAVSITYISIPDPAATSSAGTDCASLGLPSQPSGRSWHCAASSTYKNTDSTGWIPVNFKQISWGSPIGALPVDPVNNTTYYYTYVTGGSWKLAAKFEGTDNVLSLAANDGGPDPSIYEKGSDIALAPFVGGMVGWWKFEETATTTAIDYSGYANNGTMYSSTTVTDLHTSTGCKVGSRCADLDGVDDMIDVPATLSINQQRDRSFIAWIFPTTTSYERDIIDSWHNTAGNGCTGYHVGQRSDGLIYRSGNAMDLFSGSLGIPTSTFTHIAVTQRGSPATVEFYVNGTLKKTMGPYSASANGNCVVKIGGRNSPQHYDSSRGPFPGKLDDIRIYNRALSVAEIQAVYNATK